MKNINIPPYLTLTAGIVLIVIVQVALDTEEVIPQAIQFLGFILAVIGFAGLLGKLIRKKDNKNYESRNSNQ